MRHLLEPGVRTVVENWRPFVLIQALTVTLVVSYYNIPELQRISDAAQAVKDRFGIPFVIVFSVIASIGVPTVARLLTERRTDLRSAGDLIFRIGFFGSIGVLVDLLYRYMAIWFGEGVDAVTVLTKTLVDQLVFAPLVSITLTTSLFIWRDSGFGSEATMRAFRSGEFGRRYWPTLITCWFFWIPVLCAVYAMPPRLQFLTYLFTQAAWGILITNVGSNVKSEQDASKARQC